MVAYESPSAPILQRGGLALTSVRDQDCKRPGRIDFAENIRLPSRAWPPEGKSDLQRSGLRVLAMLKSGNLRLQLIKYIANRFSWKINTPGYGQIWCLKCHGTLDLS